MGANSSQRKQSRIVGELTTKLLAAGVVCDRRNLRLQYLPALRGALTAPLATKGAEGIEDVVSMMQSYCISRCGPLEHIMHIATNDCRACWRCMGYVSTAVAHSECYQGGASGQLSLHISVAFV